MMARVSLKIYCQCALATCLVLLNACASNQEPDPLQAEQRKQALQSWITCLQHEPDTTVSSLVNLHTQHKARVRACQGQELDLLATYPRHMKPSINRVMEQSAQQMLLGQAKHEGDIDALQNFEMPRRFDSRWHDVMNSSSRPRMNTLGKPPG